MARVDLTNARANARSAAIRVTPAEDSIEQHWGVRYAMGTTGTAPCLTAMELLRTGKPISRAARRMLARWPGTPKRLRDALVDELIARCARK